MAIQRSSTLGSSTLSKKEKLKMKKLSGFFATCLLVVSMSAAALADGGVTQGPGLAPPPPPPVCTTDCSEAENAISTQSLSVDTMIEVEKFVTWLTESIY